MRRLVGMILLLFTRLISLSRVVLTLLMVGAIVLSLAAVTSSAVFGTLSSVVEAIAGPLTVRTKHRTKVDGLAAEVGELVKNNESLARRNERLADEKKRLARELAQTRRAHTTRITALRQKNQRLARERADTRVTYRGKERLAKDAVKDTSQKLATRVTRASTRNVATVFAEALPVVGIGVVVAATALELRDSCTMMKDLHELDVAFNPENAIDGSEVCGKHVPDRAEVWQKVRESPAVAWSKAKNAMPELPDFSETYAYAVTEATSLMCWIFPCDTDEVIPE